jgi:Rod binding domain-containing protein
MIATLDSANLAAGAGQSPSAEPRLVRAAHQFEALMMKELLTPMSRASLDDTDGEGTGILGQFASECLAGALSAGGGLGIADRVIHTLSRSGNSFRAPGVIGNPEKNTGMNADE